MSSEQVEILQARLHQAQGVLGALQATDDGTGTVLDPHMLNSSLWAVQELLQQAQDAAQALAARGA
ncbi:hypothetical protein ACIGHJ_07995 [Stutzerimonas kunmingensis]|uniref:hypothetical protein n=1 Tax=Pseudomonadaceae TaxID=135621 RepID=UPI001C46933B|nr:MULTISPECIES: hypothetical protein [Pseudomonadaceae]